MLYWIIIIILILLSLTMPTKATGETHTVYGTMSCGWTRKQLEHFDEMGVAYKFVDCKTSDCGKFKGYPTTITPGGETKVGFFTLQD